MVLLTSIKFCIFIVYPILCDLLCRYCSSNMIKISLAIDPPPVVQEFYNQEKRRLRATQTGLTSLKTFNDLFANTSITEDERYTHTRNIPTSAARGEPPVSYGSADTQQREFIFGQHWMEKMGVEFEVEGVKQYKTVTSSTFTMS